jgi:hypothetical protein
MSRKPRVDRSPEEKWQIIQEGIKSGNVTTGITWVTITARRLRRSNQYFSTYVVAISTFGNCAAGKLSKH